MIILIVYVTVFCAILFVAGCIADYIIPAIPALTRWMESLPMWEDKT